MHTANLTFSLLWRLVVAWLAAGLVFLAADFLALSAGVNVLPEEWVRSVTFIKLKPSLMYGVSALLVLVTEGLFRANPLQFIAGKSLSLNRDDWRRLSVGLVMLLLALAVLNGVVAALLSTEAWVQYKLFGAMLCLVSGIAVLAKRTQPAQKTAA